MNSSGPVFVVSAVRSGSTLLRLMLDSHPRITNPGEFDFLFDKVTDQGEYPDVSAYTRWLSTNRIFLAHGLAVDGTLAYPDLVRSFVDQLRADGAVLTMNVHRHFHRIPYLFPEARYIHLVRDPRDVAKSCVSMGWVGHPYYGVDIWKNAELSWERLKSSLSRDRYKEIRYEDLVEDIEADLSDVCRFLGVEFSNWMMDYANRTAYGMPDPKLSHQWKRKYDDRELRLVEGKVADMLTERGYELGGLPATVPSLLERSALALKHKVYRLRFRTRKYGVLLCLEQILADRLGWAGWKDSCQTRVNRVDIQGLK